MTDKEKIRDYVLANKKHNKYRADVDRSSSSQGAYEEDERILAFIDSMQATTSAWHDSSKEPSSDTKVLVTDGAFVLVMNWKKDDKNFHLLSPLGFDHTIPLANRYVRWAYIEDILPFNKKEG